MSIYVIANPAAGKGNGAQFIPKIEQRLQEYGLEYTLVRTERPWHAAELAYQATAQGCQAVVAAGGDGTINEVLNGLMQAHNAGFGRPCLGVLCIGRGNDFAYGMGLPVDWEAGCQVLAQGARRLVDIGLIRGDCLAGAAWNGAPETGGRYFGNGIGIGFDASVNIQAARIGLGGFLGYMVAALRTILLDFRSPNLRIECDGVTITQPSLMVSVMNGRRMGGGFLMTPESRSDDGKLDLCIAHRVGRLTILTMIPRFMQGNQAGHPAIRFARSQRVVITALDGGQMPMHVDGETICAEAKNLTVEAVSGGIEIFCPRQAAGANPAG